MGADAVAGEPRYLAGGLSEKGRRESNEDAAILAVLPASPGLAAFAVLSDGMGGHNAGEVASRLTVEILQRRLQAQAAREDAAARTPASIEGEIREWIDEVNREIWARGRASAEQKGMGATVALALVLPDDRLVVANVGDSKVFLASGLGVRQLSVDHTALAEHRRALGSDGVAPEDDASNPFAHALTRSLGQEKKVEPDVRSDVTLAVGDVVILTTDGVTDVLEAERFLTAIESAGSVQEAAEEIFRLSLDAGTKDNVSVALLSRGKPARLGMGRTAGLPAAKPPAPAEPEGMLVAGAASGPPESLAPPARRGRHAAIALVALLVAVAALFIALREVPSKGKKAEGAGAGSGSPATAAAPAPPASLSPGLLPTPEPSSPSRENSDSLTSTAPTVAPPPASAAASAAAVPHPTPRPARGPAEPSFRAPSALAGLQPLEYPPTPTDTPTPTATPTATNTSTPTPVLSPTATPGKASSGKPAPSPTPAP